MVGISILIVIVFFALLLVISFAYECIFKKKLSENISGFQAICVLTSFWILCILILASNEKESLALNNWGDFLAGYFAPIVFLWLVYGVLIQKEEFKNALISLEFQQKELTNSVQTMKEQVIQTEIQHLNTWFSRNLTTINLLKDSMIKNIQVERVDSIALINYMLQSDFKREIDYFNIFDELKSILDICIYMMDYLEKLKTTKKDNYIYLISVFDIEKEFKTLLDADIKHIKEIMTIVYFLIASRKKDQYKKYQIYSHWLIKEENLINVMINYQKDTYEETMQEIIFKLKNINLDFRTGEITYYGSI